MAGKVQMGVLKVGYLAQAAREHMSYRNNMGNAKRSSAMANHPSVRGTSRSSEFHAQAQRHLASAKSNADTVRSMTATPAESFSGGIRSDNPTMN